MSSSSLPSNIGTYLGRRIVKDLKISDFFTVPGDYNLVLLDQFLKVPGLRMYNCCNELNAGYAADGYARMKEVAVLVVTFTVGGLSAINAVAGAYSDNLPLIVISGCPNSNDFGTEHVLHHTIGHPNFRQTLEAFKQVTCHTAVIKSVSNAAEKIDGALEAALRAKKPVYIEISCNIAAIEHGSLRDPCALMLPKEVSNPEELELCVQAVLSVLESAVKPVLVGGTRIRKHGAKARFHGLAEASGYATAIMPNAKGMVDETTCPNFIGTYWGQVSSPFVCETVEAADVCVLVGPIFNDYTTVGYSTLLTEAKMITIKGHQVDILGKRRFHGVKMCDVLGALAERLTKNDQSMVNFQRMFVPTGAPPNLGKGGNLTTNVLMHHIQETIKSQGDWAICAETGDSWFNGQKLRLPVGCLYEFQMQYGSIGWSVGAVLGMAAALNEEKRRVLALIGDGSFQMTAQEVSTAIRNGLNPIIVLVNNYGYTIEVEIHDGPYNNIQNWDYVKVVEGFATEKDSLMAVRVKTESEFVQALSDAASKPTHICFIECIIDRDDCSRELLEWGTRVANCNGRAPNPQ